MLKSASKISLILLLTAAILFALPNAVWASNTSEAFTGYGVGNLAGESGGTNWSTAWQNVTGAMQTTDTSCDAGDCVKAEGASDLSADRLIDEDITEGTITFKFKVVSIGGGPQIRFGDADPRFRVIINNAGATDLEATTFGTWSDNTWHTVDIEFGADGGTSSCLANQARARLDGGAYSACTAYLQAGDVDEWQINYGGTAGRELWVDTMDIVDDNPPAVAAASYDTAPYNIDLWNNWF